MDTQVCYGCGEELIAVDDILNGFCDTCLFNHMEHNIPNYLGDHFNILPNNIKQNINDAILEWSAMGV